MNGSNRILLLGLSLLVLAMPAWAGEKELYEELQRYVQWNEVDTVKQFMATHKKNIKAIVNYDNGEILKGAVGLLRDPAIIKMLLDAGANPNVTRKGNDEYNPLHIVLKECNRSTHDQVLAIVKLLVARGCDVNHPCAADGQTPLHFAARQEDAGKDIMATLLSAKDANVNARTRVIELNEHTGWTPVFYVVTRVTDPTQSNKEILKMLLDRKADLTVVSPRNQTALHHACEAQTERVDEVEMLVAAGASVNSLDYQNSTPLLVALEKNHPGICRFLLTHGADRNIKGGGFSVSPLERARGMQMDADTRRQPAPEAANVVVGGS